MTETFAGGAGHDWQGILDERVERAARRRERLAQERREVGRRRAHGLIDRQAARLARARAGRAGPRVDGAGSG